MNPTQVLIDEHSGIMVILKVLEKINSDIENGKKVNIQHLDEIVEFFKVFVDQCHHSKEEVYLFPTIESFGYDADRDLIKELLDEHKRGREIVVKIKNALKEYNNEEKDKLIEIKKEIGEYVTLLTEHINKENTILFPRADNLFSNDENSEMIEEFNEIETDVIGIGRHEEFHMMIEEFKKIYLPNH